MKFDKIEFYNFRNIKTKELITEEKNIILKGINGQGKTNILEAIYTLSYGSSFRTNNNKEMICFNENEMRISSYFSYEGQKNKLDFILKNNKREIYLNKKLIKDRKELIYYFPCIVFSHDDINFIKGDHEKRRNFFDQMISLFNPLYLDNLRRYKVLLKQRNAAIKENKIYLCELYNERLAICGLYLKEERIKCIEEFNNILPKVFKKISKTKIDLKIKYISSWDNLNNKEEICEYLKINMEKDINLKTTTSGPHRDRYIVECENGPFIQSGSTGQLRLASLLFRISEVKYFYNKTGKEPTILIDDVLLELDNKKRGDFLKELENYSQAFFTFLPDEKYFKEKNEYTEYIIKEGYFEKV